MLTGARGPFKGKFMADWSAAEERWQGFEGVKRRGLNPAL
jgi:hypothetical protein